MQSAFVNVSFAEPQEVSTGGGIRMRSLQECFEGCAVAPRFFLSKDGGQRHVIDHEVNRCCTCDADTDTSCQVFQLRQQLTEVKARHRDVERRLRDAECALNNVQCQLDMTVARHTTAGWDERLSNIRRAYDDLVKQSEKVDVDDDEWTPDLDGMHALLIKTCHDEELYNLLTAALVRGEAKHSKKSART